MQRSAHLALLVQPKSDVSVAIDHFQLLQVIQLQTKIAELADHITMDREFFNASRQLENLQDTPIAVYAHVDKLQLKLVLPVGAVPSPYDLSKRAEEDEISPSATSTSLESGGLPQFISGWGSQIINGHRVNRRE